MIAKIHEYPSTSSPNGSKHAADSLQQTAQESILERWFLPHQETQVVAQSASKGVFIPWPLLAIIVTLAIVLVTGLVTLEVQVSNLSTTLLLRDADHARQLTDIKVEMARVSGKNEQLQVYITNDREKLVAIETRLGIRR